MCPWCVNFAQGYTCVDLGGVLLCHFVQMLLPLRIRGCILSSHCLLLEHPNNNSNQLQTLCGVRMLRTHARTCVCVCVCVAIRFAV